MSNKPNKCELLKQITALEFCLIDLNLYLNTHPMDYDAIARYNSLVNQLNMVKKTYERYFGMITANNSCSSCPWQWIEEPWPWEYEANFKF